ncbi:MAG TPA: helix-turn-helix domain-containing protein [Leptolyngbyaceae cyanobacterium M65_K2018_010]|nr:helix-turn-helix domain-containing protein [Leptolyngbyaceae cyanobacterium M65_K2018_010]
MPRVIPHQPPLMAQSNLAETLALPDLTLAHRFQDLDDFGQAVLSQGLTLTQLETGPFLGHIVQVSLAGLRLIRLTTNRGLYTSGPKPKDAIIFCTCLHEPNQPLISHGQALPSQALFGFDPNRENRLITPQGLELAMVIVPIARLDPYLQTLERDDLDRRFFQRNALPIAGPHGSTLRAYLQQIFHLAQTNPALVQQAQALIAGDLLPLLVNCFSAEVCPNLRIYPFRRSDLVQQAETYMRANLDQPLTLEAMCQALKTSKSALSYGFQEIFGLSPMAYLKAVRLNGVRRALKASDPTQATVLGIANRYGFWHMGHFSRDYRQMFGESPSETLRGEEVRAR